ncbi:acyl-CoA thioesterase [Streptomyces albipurpureus]|uniref:Acyl-CoA thioesterase n=1 Tax=Streptomyces albipurpureus TaxID=2897419 RepID=A0ABT0UXX0_9ACTN|nr:thioesterase family protein [Streptomyces sp. CWNU-1]MCM2392006.1 acyl-CoA thioesterase [Streptomyces sp. CWNU-1]
MARHIYSCPLRWSDMDAFGHVNNVVFLRYLEEARIDFMFRLAPGDGSPSFSGGSVVARHEIDYIRPLVHRHEPVIVESWVTRIGAASLTIAYEIKDEVSTAEGPGGAVDAPQVYVRASTVVVPYDLEAARPRRISPEEKSFLQQYLPETGAEAGAQAATEPETQPVPASDSRAADEGALVA